MIKNTVGSVKHVKLSFKLLFYLNNIYLNKLKQIMIYRNLLLLIWRIKIVIRLKLNLRL